MADLPIEQLSCRAPERKRPDHIAMPVTRAVRCTQQSSKSGERVVSKDLTALSPPPRPPVPPRRHTLAEICRYTDEQCAYIEYMTRELEAEEAARRHSSPTTPAGAITNPFSGPADMWWRPISANEMYGKSALRRQQEEEEEEKARMQHPYLATNGLPEFLETNRPKKDDRRTDEDVETITDEVNLISSESQALEVDTECPADTSILLGEAEYDISVCFASPREYDAWLRRGRALASNQLSQDWQNVDPPYLLKQDSIILMIPKAVLCFLLLPLILAIGWCNSSYNEDEEEEL